MYSLSLIQAKTWSSARHASPVSSRLVVKGVKKEAKTFSIAGDLNVELAMMCTDESDIEEFNEIYDPLCWQGYTHDPGGHKKFMWYSIMKEFRCKVSSAWSSHNLSWRRRWSHMLATSCASSFCMFSRGTDHVATRSRGH